MKKLEALKVRGVQKEEKREKNTLCELESLFLFLFFFHYSFSFAFQRSFLKLEVAFPWHFKSLKMKHIWWKSKEMIDDKVIFGDEQF